MKRKTKDFAYAIKVQRNELKLLFDSIEEDETRFYKQWNEVKKDKSGNPKIKDGVIQTRPINAPIDRLKQIQSKILWILRSNFPLPDYFFGGVKGKDAVKNGRFHQGNKFFFQTDFKGFYTSIHSKWVEETLRKRGFHPDVARLITRICTTKGSIPQGCPTSSYLAAMVLDDRSNTVFQKYINLGFKVTVYVDDITISSPIDFKDQTTRILEELREAGFQISFEKCSYKTKDPEVTGVVVKNNGICATNHSYRSSIDKTKSEASRSGHKNRIDYIKKVSKKKG
ncbi:reverse transcriptase family protein [Algoriphagus halophytocola]|uniref:RNA-directed DNA polymerase n=1 Tax=Algoriphagus halophytocola TaxID=2991499 RepID=A0ABY6MEU3_9BACT|nr:reverse transcriptase family protein [Algoriphagus sp. TR-M5]UZD21151.1 reverse transcriptase family protein [Algoriphagus sp. TR-M5]